MEVLMQEFSALGSSPGLKGDSRQLYFLFNPARHRTQNRLWSENTELMGMFSHKRGKKR